MLIVIGGIDIVLLVFFVRDRSLLDLVLAALLTVGLPWTLLAVPGRWLGTWSVDMTVQGPDAHSEGVLLWRAICDGLEARGFHVDVGGTQTRLLPAPQTDASGYVRDSRTHMRLVNTLVQDPRGQPLLSSHLVLEPDERPSEQSALRSALTDILVAERRRYREEAMRKGVVPRSPVHRERLN